MSVDILQHLPDDGRFKLLEEKCQQGIPDLEASFSVRLFPEGFSIGKPLERAKAAPPAYEAMGMLYPYNRTSERFLRALDGGWIPGDLLEDIPCKYVNGCIACEVLDYCVNAPSSTDTGLIFSPKSSMDVMPVVYKITLKPTTESIVKDVSLMVDETWTYKDLMEVESKILKTAWPELHLDPKSTSNQTEKKAMLRSGQKIFKHYRTNKGALMDRRLRLAASVKAMVKGGSLVNSKKIAFEVPPERLTGEANSDTVTTNSDVSTQSAVKSKTSGPMGSIAQFPLSPTSSMSGTWAGHEPTGITMEKQLSMLGRRDARDFRGVKLDTKKFKQDSPRLDKFPLHIDKSLLRSDHKTDQEQDIKPASMGHQDALELMKFETQLNSDQQRIEDSARMRDEKSGFGVDSGQSQHHDPQLSSQRLAQQDIERQSWQVLSPVGDRDSKQDDLLQRKKLLVMPQKPDDRVFQQSLVNDIPHMSSGMAQNVTTAVGASNNPALVSSSSSTLIQPKDQLQVSGTIAGVLGGPSDPMQQLPRRRTNSLPKNTASVAGVASPGSTINSGGMQNVNSPSTASMPSLASLKSEGLMVAGQRKELMDTFVALLSTAQRNGLPPKKRKVEPAPASDNKKTSPSWQLLLVALANTSSDDVKDPKGQRNMADSLVGGNVNVRKTRFLQFQRQIIQGSHYRRVRVRLVMCERGKDAMVEAVVQFGDDQDDEMLNSVPHHVLPTMANAHAADIFAKQFCALLEKEGFELVEDQVQPTMPRGNATAASAARPLPAGASTLGNSLGLLPSPRSLMNQHMSGMAAVSGMPGMPPMQPSSPSTLAATRMPPPGNASNRQMSATYLGQAGVNTSSKPLQLDGSASQLSAVQHPQQHQPSPHLQRAQQMVMPPQLAQLNYNSAQQINQQMVASQGQLQQFLQQRQQAQTSAFQRKLLGMGNLGPMGNLGGVGIPVSGGNQGGLGNMVGVNAMNNVVGMSGISNVSASMGSISGINNVGQLQGMVAMGQNTGLGSLIGRSGNITAALTSKTHLAQGRSGHPVGATNPTARENLTGLNAPNQVHVSAGLSMVGQSMSRVGRVVSTPIQRAAPVGSLGSPRVATSNMPAVAGQGMYLNPSQQVSSQQQFNLQQLSPLQQNGQQQAMNAPQLQLTQPQQVNTQVQQQNPQQQVNLQQPKNTQQALNPQIPLLSQTQQQQPQQQPQPQQLNPQGQINSASQQHNSVGGLGSLVGGPASPQLSSQNVGSVTSAAAVEPSITNGSAAPLSSG